MARKRAAPAPPSAEACEQVLATLGAAAEPLSARELAQALPAPQQIAEKELIAVLAEFVAAGRLYAFPGKTARAKPLYWNRDARAISREAALDALRQSEAPLTAKELLARTGGRFKIAEAELARYLDAQVDAGLLHSIAPATARGKPRYSARDPIELGQLEIRRILAAKGPLPEASLRKALKHLADGQFRAVVEKGLTARELWRHPALTRPKRKELLALRPATPEPYLQEAGHQLAKAVALLLEAGVSRDELRRAMVQLVEATGISFGSASTTQAAQDAARPQAGVDLVGLLRRLEPGADRGALVGVRELRRAARLGKPEFDRAVLDLAREGRLSLHRHDYPASLSAQERDDLVTDGAGAYYVGVAIRQSESL